MKHIILDCDPGIDDSIAIILAARSPELKIEAITTVTGNLLADRTSVNARKTLELIQREDIPVAQGCLHPLVRKYPRDPFSHGDDGLGNTHLPEPHMKLDPRFATQVICDTVHAFAGNITLVATGPLTNVALAILQEPEIAKMVNDLIIIGGAFGFNEYASTNATGDNPVSEWNIFVDPEAAKIVFHSGMPITAIGLDVATHPGINLSPQYWQLLENSNRVEAKYMLGLLNFVKQRGFQDYCVMIDAMAIAAAIDPTLVDTQKIHVDIETQSDLALGQTVVDRRNNFRWSHLPQIQGACGADFQRFHDLLIQRLAG